MKKLLYTLALCFLHNLYSQNMPLQPTLQEQELEKAEENILKFIDTYPGPKATPKGAAAAMGGVSLDGWWKEFKKNLKGNIVKNLTDYQKNLDKKKK